MSAPIEGGLNIAIKVPVPQYEATLAFYRDVLRLTPFDEKPPHKGFVYGLNRLWIDPVPHLSQAEVWLELFTPDFPAAAAQLAASGVTRNDALENLGEGFAGGWFVSPSNIVHLLRTPDAF